MIELEGPGWRLARDPLRGKFSVLLGGDSWAIEITEYEWDSLVPLIIELIEEHEKIKNQLMPEELISLEMEKDSWWACLDGDRNQWSLKIILEGDEVSLRGIEAFWPPSSAKDIAFAMRTMWDSCD